MGLFPGRQQPTMAGGKDYGQQPRHFSQLPPNFGNNTALGAFARMNGVEPSSPQTPKMGGNTFLNGWAKMRGIAPMQPPQAPMTGGNTAIDGFLRMQLQQAPQPQMQAQNKPQNPTAALLMSMLRR